MASLQKKGDAWYCQFKYGGKRHTITIGEVSDTEARQWKSRTEAVLMRLSQNLLQIPRGVSIADFILHDGKPPVDPELAQHRETTLHQLREAYLTTFSNGAIESNTLYTAGIHLDHIEETLDKKFILSGLTLGKLQAHVNRRAKDVSPVTIKKELDTFRSAWNWGFRMKWVDMPFPSKGLVYPKTDEKLPFMTWEEIDAASRPAAMPTSFGNASTFGRSRRRNCLSTPRQRRPRTLCTRWFWRRHTRAPGDPS